MEGAGLFLNRIRINQIALEAYVWTNLAWDRSFLAQAVGGGQNGLAVAEFS